MFTYLEFKIMENLLSLVKEEEKLKDKFHLASLQLMTYRDESRKSPFIGRKLIIESNFDSPTDVENKKQLEFNAIVVGYVSPRFPDNWGCHEEVIVKNHPNWGTKWETVVCVPDSNGVLDREYPLPATEDDICRLSFKLARYSDIDGIEDVVDRLNEIVEEVHDLTVPRDFDNSPEVGYYLVMNLDVESDKFSDRFDCLHLGDIISYTARTVKHLNGTGRHDLVVPFDWRSFLALHEEVAVTAKIFGDPDYGSMKELFMAGYIKGFSVSFEDLAGLLNDDVVRHYGSFSSAMEATFEHCSSFSLDADKLMSMDEREYPDYISQCLDDIKREKRKFFPGTKF